MYAYIVRKVEDEGCFEILYTDKRLQFGAIVTWNGEKWQVRAGGIEEII